MIRMHKLEFCLTENNLKALEELLNSLPETEVCQSEDMGARLECHLLQVRRNESGDQKAKIER